MEEQQMYTISNQSQFYYTYFIIFFFIISVYMIYICLFLSTHSINNSNNKTDSHTINKLGMVLIRCLCNVEK